MTNYPCHMNNSFLIWSRFCCLFALKRTYDDLGNSINSNVEIICEGRLTGNSLHKETGNTYVDFFSSEERELTRTTNTFF